MRRIFPPHAYGEEPRAGCYWPTTVTAPETPVARGILRADVAVIGAGYTGLNAALHLAEAGADVILLEAESPGWGASGRNGGFCCLGGSAASDRVLTRLYGEEARRDYRMSERHAVDHVSALIERLGLSVDRHSEGETVMAHTSRAMQGFEARAQEIERDYGVTPTLLQQSDLAQAGLNGPFHGALTTPVGFAMNPLKYANGLAEAALAAGVRIFAASPVQRIEQSAEFALTTPEARIAAKRLVVATNGYSSDDLPDWIRARYIPTQSNVLVTREMTPQELQDQGWTSHQACYDDRFFLHYFRLMPNGRMLFGMRGGLFSSEQSDQRMHANIRRHFDTMFPAWKHVETPHSWHGLLSISRDLTPFAGAIPEMPGAFAGLSYHGNGVAMGSYSGAILAALAMDRVPDLPHCDILKTPPRRFPLGKYRRAWFWPVYGAAFLTGG